MAPNFGKKKKKNSHNNQEKKISKKVEGLKLEAAG